MTAPTIEPAALPTKQAAEFLGIKPKTLKRLPIPRVRAGYRTLLWPVKGLRAWLEGRAA